MTLGENDFQGSNRILIHGYERSMILIYEFETNVQVYIWLGMIKNQLIEQFYLLQFPETTHHQPVVDSTRQIFFVKYIGILPLI